MSLLSNEYQKKWRHSRFLRAIRREPVDMTPIWIMRQAGRYLPEYRETRARAGNFMRLCQTPDWACEVTLQPLARFPLDAAIIFSDILTIPDAMGLGLSFTEGHGPHFARPIRSAHDINHLVFERERLQYVYDTIQLVQRALSNQTPLIGFCGSPWTVAAYMIEGGSQPGFPLAQTMRAQAPAMLHHLLDTLTLATITHLNAQIAAGVDVVMIFDTWGGLLSTADYALFSLAYIKQVIAGLQLNAHQQKTPVILFTKDGGQWLQTMVTTGCDVIGVSSEVTLMEARARVNDKVALQGNLAPACLLESPEQIRAAVRTILASYGQGSGHIFNLAHGVTPDVPPDHVAVLVEAVHELSQPYHQGDRGDVCNTFFGK